MSQLAMGSNSSSAPAAGSGSGGSKSRKKQRQRNRGGGKQSAAAPPAAAALPAAGARPAANGAAARGSGGSAAPRGQQQQGSSGGAGGRRVAEDFHELAWFAGLAEQAAGAEEAAALGLAAAALSGVLCDSAAARMQHELPDMHGINPDLLAAWGDPAGREALRGICDNATASREEQASRMLEYLRMRAQQLG
jgi:hypothetical protein